MPINNGFRYTEKDDHIIIRAYCGNETEVIVPDLIKGKPVTEIVPFAFVPLKDQNNIVKNDFRERCSERVRSIILPKTILRLEGAFACCIELEEIFIPQNAELIGNANFRLCHKLSAIHVDSDHKLYMSRNGILYSKDGKTLLRCPPDHALHETNYLDGVEEISRDAFEYCENLQTLVIPTSVSTIQSGAFYACSNLKSATLHDNLLLSGGSHFAHCKSLESIIYYNNANVIPAGEFYWCENLRTINIESKIRSIGSSAFFESGLREIVIPKGVTSINQDAFMHCKVLKTITLPRSVSRIHAMAFWRCGADYISDKIDSKDIQVETACTFVVIPGSKAEVFCLERGYTVVYA